MSALLDSSTRRPAAEPPAATLTPELARRLLIVAFRPSVVAFTLAAAVIVIALVAANSDLTGLAGAVAASWLAIHQVQITIGSTAIGVLPLLPTLLLGWGVARTCAKAVEATTSRRELSYVVAAAIAGPLSITVACLAVIADASAVLPLAPPFTPAALGWVVLIHGLAAIVGIRGKLLSPADVPTWVPGAVSAAVAAGKRLAIAAAVVTCLSIVASWPDAMSVYHGARGFSGVVGLTLLSVAYFPNVVVATTAVVTGASAAVGDASVSLFGVVGGPVPGVPVLAAVPTGEPRSWWLVLLVVPAYVAVRLGRDCATAATDRVAAAKSAGLAALIVGTCASVASFAAGGSLGSFGYVGADAAMFSAMTAAWLFLLGATTALVVGKAERVAVEPAAPEQVTEVADHADVVADPPAVDAEIVDDDQPALEPAAATGQDEPVDAEVVDLPDKGDEPAG